jgi:hypothetical protein
MPFPHLDDACPFCRGILFHFAFKRHPERHQYTIHRYHCMDHGPVVDITAPTDDEWPNQWLNNEYSQREFAPS